MLVLVLAVPSAQATSVYNGGSYGDCAYQADCPPPPSPPIVTSTGLQVSINLANGQQIPLSGYTIVVTPLNGQGSSFKQVDFYVNGQLVHTAQPEQTGTARWLWVPERAADATVRVVVTDQAGKTVEQTFSVQVVAVADNNRTPSGGASSSGGGRQEAAAAGGPLAGLIDMLQRGYSGFERTIKALPSPVVNGFPYILLALLAANIALLLLQQQRELREYRVLRQQIARQQALSEAKKTFIQLVAHYLRTPLTVIRGGIDLMQTEHIVTSDSVDVAAIAQRMQRKIEALIQQTRDTENSLPAAVVGAGAMPKERPAWRRPALYVPVVLIGLAAGAFNYVVAHAGNLNVSQTSMGVQLLVFVLLVLGIYQVHRRLQLHRHDRRLAEQLAAEALAFDRARNDLITNTVAALSTDLQALNTVGPATDASKGVRYMHEGQNRFHEMLTKFSVAAQLRGTQSDQPYVSLPFSALLNDAKQSLLDKAATKQINIVAQGEAAISTQSVELLEFVLNSLIDNAIAYSSQGGTVTVSAQATTGETVITVSDQGSGIPAEKMELLFQPLAKAEGAETFTHEGMGFSLYLDKLIMGYLGGTIELASKGGTTATLRLPLRSIPNSEVPKPSLGAVVGNVG